MANMVTVSTITEDLAAFYGALTDYINQYGAMGITMELRVNVPGNGPVNYPVNQFSSVGTVPNFVYTAPADLVYTDPNV